MASWSPLLSKAACLSEGGSPATRCCPVLIKHSDCDGQWTPQEASLLLREFDLIQAAFSNSPPMAFNADWKGTWRKRPALIHRVCLTVFFDIDGEPLKERLRGLAKVRIESDALILFQWVVPVFLLLQSLPQACLSGRSRQIRTSLSGRLRKFGEGR